ncbi:unnamed protein product [Toxocara canis]|uniref:Bacteriocin n=1 Tax=Toxocara canis TaxID=6265 RepID=A0A183UZ72_TOXCA|nr:unnamed protein product [Toxocara canis]
MADPSLCTGQELRLISKVKVRENEFSGLIGNLAGNLIRDKVGGGAGQFLGGLADNVFGGEG